MTEVVTTDAPVTMQVTKSFRALLEARTPVVVLEGSSGSGKTWSILQYLILWCQREAVTGWCYRYDGTTCEGSVIRDFKIVMRDLGLWESASWNDQRKQYTFSSGAVWRFGGCQDPQKLHGARQDWVWFNEAMEISWDAYSMATIRTARMVILDYNPSLSRHWIYDRVLKQGPARVTFIHSTFRDNPLLPAEAKKQILSYEPTAENVQAGTADTYRWQVYGLGQRGRREGVVFKTWTVVDEYPEAHQCQKWGYGLDFGYSQDPTTLIECALWNESVWLREIVYEPGLLVTPSLDVPTLPSLHRKMEDARVSRRARIHAESAQPENLTRLLMAGWNVVATRKSATSVMDGIQRMQGVRLCVLRSAQNVQRELEGYVWKKERATGRYLDEPEDRDNHAIDAVRYWFLGEMHPLPPPDGGTDGVRVYRPARTTRREWDPLA